MGSAGMAGAGVPASDLAAIVLAAGRGRRMRSPLPKVLHPILGAPLLRFPLDALEQAGVREKIVVVGGGAGSAIGEAFRDYPGLRFAEQPAPHGTGHAVWCARQAWEEAGAPPVIIVACGDAPLQLGRTLAGLVEAHRRAGADATVLTARVPDPTGYGRIVRDAGGGLARIVEEAQASAEQRAIAEVNAGTYVFSAAALWEALAGIMAEPPRRGRDDRPEHYLTDVIEALRARGQSVATAPAQDAREVLGVNTRRELADAQAVLLERALDRLMEAGVAIPYPDKVVVEVDVEVGERSALLPFTVIERGVRVGRGCEVGPFAHLATGAVLEDGAAIGNFVEVKRTRVGEGAKAKHLAYLGDGAIGAKANIGAGTVLCNYDGKHKHASAIGEGAFVGSGTMLVAPVEMGAGSRTGAGAVVRAGTRIGAGETWVGVPARRIGGEDRR